MAHIIGGVACSHIPSIGSALAKGLQEDPYWKPFFDGFPPVQKWLHTSKVDVAVVFYNDHGLNFFLDKMPTFAVGAAATYSNADEGWGIPVSAPINGNQMLSWHLIDKLIQDEFDIVSCQEMLVDHALTIPLKLLWPDMCPVTVVPICINTVQFPLPSAKRVYALGQSVGRAIRDWDENKNVVILGTGGLSHQLDGTRAGFINKKFDRKFMDSLLNEPQWATRFSSEELVEQTGTQGVELLMWLAMRGSLGDAQEFKIHKIHENYHIPISNTATGLLAFECA